MPWLSLTSLKPLQETSYCICGNSDIEDPTGDEHRTVDTRTASKSVTLLTYTADRPTASNVIEWHSRQAVCACVCVLISNGLGRYGSSCGTRVLAVD